MIYPKNSNSQNPTNYLVGSKVAVLEKQKTVARRYIVPPLAVQMMSEKV
jgi:hypothetical protein